MELLNNKPLLELLSPFADKTLSEGCIIEFEQEVNYKKKYIGKIILTDGKLINNKLKGKFSHYKINGKGTGYGVRVRDKDIIVNFGHIGITTVLKYIDNTGCEILIQDPIIRINLTSGKWYKKTYQIKNKELNLYTKQELEELYNLLKELG